VSSLYPASTIKDLIVAGKDDADVLGAPERPARTYKDLRELVQRTVESLNAMGNGRNDRVAIVLPNRPR
jgi:oxalate---CoA ligase